MKGSTAPLLLLLMAVLNIHIFRISCSRDSSKDKADLEAEVLNLRAEAAKQPHSALLQMQLATALHKLNHINPDGGRRIAEAAAAYRAAIKALASDSEGDRIALRVSLQGNLGALLLAGDMAEDAIAELQSALQTAETNGLPLIGADKAKKLWIQAGDALDVVWLHFALHKYYHQSREYDLAWHYLEVGNRVMAAVVKYDPAVDQHNLHHIKAIFRAPFLSGHLEDNTPIFVVGMPRSGSTLVEQMLASHSQVWAAGEDTALAPLTTDVNKQMAKPNINHSKVCKKLGRRYITLMRGRLPSPSPQPSAADGDGDIASQLEMTWELVEHWEHELPGRMHTVFYEDLVAHPEVVAKDLLAACGLDWEPAVLDFQQTDRPVQTASVVQVRQPLYHSAVGRWKVYGKQLAELQQRLAPLTAKYEKLLHLSMQRHAALDEAKIALQQVHDSHSDPESAMTGPAASMKDEL
eukprot:gene11563-11707_t